MQIVVTLRVSGFHQWYDAPPQYDFLAQRHRHMFHIKATKAVFCHDREIEIIEFKEGVVDWLYGEYGAPCEFGGMSCESIATQLIETFGLTTCEVLEDGENGALATSE